MAGKVPEPVRRLEITGEMDRHTVEAFSLEVRRLARRHGLDVKRFRIEKLEEGSGGRA